MAINDLTDAIMDHLVDMLDNGRVEINAALAAKGYSSEISRIWRDGQKVIAKYPSIAINADTKEVSWAATRVRDEKYTFSIDCLTKILKKEEAARFIRCFGSAVQNWLNDFYNLRTTIKGTDILIWDSFADNITYGYRQEGALRVARVNWYCKTCNPVTV